jgi:hypothetical protein
MEVVSALFNDKYIFNRRYDFYYNPETNSANKAIDTTIFRSKSNGTFGRYLPTYVHTYLGNTVT